MRHHTLAITATILLLIYVDSLVLQTLIIVVSLFYHISYFKHYCILILVFCFVFISSINKTPDIPEGNNHIIRVEEIRDNYIVGSNKNEKYIVYNVTGVDLYDVLNIVGTFQEIKTTNNLRMFHYATYLKRKSIHYSIYAKRFHVVSNANHIKAKLYRYIQSFDKESKENMNALLYRNYENDFDYKHFLFASGIHLSVLINIVHRRLKKNKHAIACTFSFLAYTLLPFSPYMLRIFTFNLVPLILSQLSKREQFSLSMLFSMLITPSIAYEVTFLIPVCMRLVYLFDIKQVFKVVKRYLVLIPIQLFFFHEVNVVTICLFPLIKMLQVTNFILLLLSLIFHKMTILFNFFYGNSNCINK